MRHFLFVISILLFFAISACTNRLSEISICSNLKEGDSISVALYSKIEDRYITVNGVALTSKDAIDGKVYILLPDSLIYNIGALSITVHRCSDRIFSISSIRLKNYAKIFSRDIMTSSAIYLQYGLKFELDSKSKTIKSLINKNIPGTFFVSIDAFMKSSHPLGFQLFLRLSFLATLLILTFILVKIATTQRLLLFSIALFLASLPLLLFYAIYAMAFMSLIMVIAFIYDKSRRFTWHPVFYVLCAMFLMNVIGLWYTVDFEHGFRRLDTLVVFVLFPVIFSMIRLTQKNVTFLLRFFVWSVIAFCTFGLLSYATIVPELTWNMVFRDSKLYAPLLLMWPSFEHPSVVSVILLMAVPVSIYLSSFQFSVFSFQIQRIETFLGVLLPIVFTVLCGARIGMIIAPVLLLLGYVFYCKFKPALKWGLVVAGISASVFLLHLYPKIDDRFTDPIREDLKEIAISAIKEKPIFGWGTGSAKSLIQSEERAHSLGIETHYDLNQFHNQYLEDMAQFGIPGILILLTVFGWILWTGVREKDFLLLSLFTIQVLSCWADAPLMGSKGALSFTFWLCFLVANRENMRMD